MDWVILPLCLCCYKCSTNLHILSFYLFIHFWDSLARLASSSWDYKCMPRWLLLSVFFAWEPSYGGDWSWEQGIGPEENTFLFVSGVSSEQLTSSTSGNCWYGIAPALPGDLFHCHSKEQSESFVHLVLAKAQASACGPEVVIVVSYWGIGGRLQKCSRGSFLST